MDDFIFYYDIVLNTGKKLTETNLILSNKTHDAKVNF